MVIWLLRSSAGSQFLFPTESSFNKTAVLSYVSALFIFDLKKLVLFFIYLKNIEKQRKIKNLLGQFLLNGHKFDFVVCEKGV